MSKRRDTLRSLLAVEAPPPDDGATRAPEVKSAGVVAPSVRAFGLSVSFVEEEVERLKGLLAEGARVVELDPDDVHPSPIGDRMDDDGPQAIAALKASIAENGQQVPILVRPSPSEPGRYEAAYGHRRLRAARELGLPIRAVVRALGDEEMVLAQGIENSARQDLTWIEQAVFARRMSEAGHAQKVVAAALSIPRETVSRMVATAREIPGPVLRAIGRAPKAGRPRWMALVAAFKDGVPKAVHETIASPLFHALPSDERFARVFRAAREAEAAQREPQVIATPAGRTIGSLTLGAKAAQLRIDDPAFGAWLAQRVPGLHGEYLAIAAIGHRYVADD